MQRLLAYLQLFRLPNVFTAIADVLMGFFFVQAGVQPVPWLVSLVLATCLLYTAGMVLNDYFDYEVDKQERPQRPLPSGRIDHAWAGKLGLIMLTCGVASAWLASPRSGIVSVLLAATIYLYDGVAKKTAIGPMLMGQCRMLNVLLGMSCSASGFTTEHLLVSGGLGVYVMGITWFARSEARASDRKLLIFGFALMIVGVALLGAWPQWVQRELTLSPAIMWPLLLALIMASVIRRCLIAISDPEPGNVQLAVKHSIFSLVVLDAAVVLAVLGPAYAITVVALLLPTTTLGRWVYST